MAGEELIGNVDLSYNDPSLASDCGWPLDDGKTKRLLRGQPGVYRVNGIHYPGPLRSLFLLAERMGTGVIYMYTSPSGKKYIGQTWDEKRRKRNYVNGGKGTPLFANAIKKYGIENMQYEILHSSIEEQDELNRLEDIEIRRNNCIHPHGYNLKSGGSNGKFSDISKNKMSASQNMRYINNPKAKLDSRKFALEIWSRSEYRDKIIAQIRQRNSSEEFKSAARARAISRWNDVNIRKKLIDSMNTPECKEKMYNAHEFRSKRIVCIETNIIYRSMREAERILGIPNTSISLCCRGLAKTAGKLHWKFA